MTLLAELQSGAQEALTARPRGPAYIAQGEIFTMMHVLERELEERIHHELPHLSLE